MFRLASVSASCSPYTNDAARRVRQPRRRTHTLPNKELDSIDFDAAAQRVNGNF